MNIPSHEELMAIKRKKKVLNFIFFILIINSFMIQKYFSKLTYEHFQLLTLGTEKFNTKPKKGIEFLQEHGILSTPLNSIEIAMFLKENPLLDKKMIGEYISKNNVDVLNSFIKYLLITKIKINIKINVIKFVV